MNSRINYLLDGHTTERLLLRKIEVTDFDACRPFFLNPQSNRYWKSAITDPNELARAGVAMEAKCTYFFEIVKRLTYKLFRIEKHPEIQT